MKTNDRMKEELLDSRITIFRWDCMTEGLTAVSYNEETDMCIDAPYIEIAFWLSGHPDKYCWKYRIRHIWRIIRKGYPYVDMVTFEKESAEKFARHILKMCSET